MLTVYLHDHPDALRFQLEGALSGEGVGEFEQNWRTAASTLRGRGIVVDLSDVSGIDRAGERLMRAMVEAGARLVTASREAEGLAAALSGRVPEVLGQPKVTVMQRLRCWWKGCCGKAGAKVRGCFPRWERPRKVW